MARHKKSIWGRLGALTLGLLITIFLTELILRFVMPNWTEFWSGNFIRAISVPGYGPVNTGLPNFNGYFSQNNGDFRVHISINKFGLRNPKPISASNNAIWVVGDSMTFGWGVEQQNCAEFCPHTHHFRVNGHEYVKSNSEAGLGFGCLVKSSAVWRSFVQFNSSVII